MKAFFIGALIFAGGCVIGGAIIEFVLMMIEKVNKENDHH